MKKRYRILIWILGIFFITNIVSCTKKNVKNQGNNLNIYMDIKDNHSLNAIKFLLEEYKKEQPGTNINITNSMGGNILEDATKGKAGDIIFTSRNKMIELQSKGMLTELASYYEKNSIKEKYYNIISSYGRYFDKYYGIGILPYTIEILYNRNALEKLQLPFPEKIEDVKNIGKKLNEKSIKVPVIFTDDIEINNALASLIMSNKNNSYDVDNIYNSSIQSYKNKKEFQYIFDTMSSIYKEGIINKNTFELGNENSIEKLNNSDIPIAVSISYYHEKFDDHNIGIVEDYSHIGSFKGNVPVIVNALLCIPINDSSENGNEVDEFIKFVYSDKTQKKFFKKGFLSGNKKINKDLKGNSKIISKHLEDSNENSIVFLYNIPEKFGVTISSKIDKILSGQYTGKEWNEIVEEIFKYNKENSK